MVARNGGVGRTHTVTPTDEKADGNSSISREMLRSPGSAEDLLKGSHLLRGLGHRSSSLQELQARGIHRGGHPHQSGGLGGSGGFRVGDFGGESRETRRRSLEQNLAKDTTFYPQPEGL